MDNHKLEKFDQNSRSQPESPVGLSCDTYAGMVHVEDKATVIL